MKKLIVLTAVVMLTASAAGCQCGRWFRRGAMVPYCPPESACCEPCPAPCGPPSDGCDACTAPTFGTSPMPGPETYVPVPSG